MDLASILDLGPHADFILAAYGMGIVVIVLLIGWVVLDHRAQTRRIADLEARGITRRSSAPDDRGAAS